MNPTYQIHHAKAEQFLKGKPDNSIPAILSDFPYGLKFMGKKWDYGLPSQEAVAEMYRALIPSGYLLGFSSPRTYHRLAVLLEAMARTEFARREYLKTQDLFTKAS